MHFDFRVEFFPFVAKFMKTLEESRNDLNIVWTWGPFIVVSLRSFFIREEPTPYFPPPFLFFGLASPKDRSAVTGLNAKHRNMHANWRRPSSPIVSLPFLPSFLSFFFFPLIQPPLIPSTGPSLGSKALTLEERGMGEFEHARVNPLIGMPRVSFPLRYYLHTVIPAYHPSICTFEPSPVTATNQMTKYRGTTRLTLPTSQ